MPRGENTDYLDELGWAECKRIVQTRLREGQWHEDPITGCWLWDGRTLPDGYMQFKMVTPKQRREGSTGRNAGKNLLLHKVAFVAETGQNIEVTGSHLCDRPQCFRGTHIADETMTENNSRKGCRGVLLCPDHGHEIVNLCVHTPPCIRPPPPGVKCCLSKLQESAVPSSPPAGAAPQDSGAAASSSTDSDPVRPPGKRRISRVLTDPASDSDSPLPLPSGGPSQAVQEYLDRDPRNLPGAELLSETGNFIVNDDDEIVFDTQPTGEGELAGLPSSF